MNKKNEEFFNQILLEMSAPVETMIKRLCRDPGLAEDIMQDIFLEIYKNIAKLAVHENYKGWVILTAKNKLQKRLMTEQNYYQRFVPIEEAGEEHLYDNSVREEQDMKELLGMLSDEDARLLRGYYLHGSSSVQLAGSLHTSEPAFRMKLFRARKRAQKILEKEFGSSLLYRLKRQN